MEEVYGGSIREYTNITMEYLSKFYRRIEEIYRDPSLNDYEKFVNLMKVFYNMHSFYIQNYEQIISEFGNKFNEAEHLRTMLHNSNIALMRSENEYQHLVLEYGYKEDNEKIKNMVVSKISETIEFLERKIAIEFRV